MLVDWSSRSHVGQQHKRRLYDDIDNDNESTYGIAPISPIAAPVLLSLLLGKWGTARRSVFGQVLVAGQSSNNADGSRNGVLIDRRNERAMDVLRRSSLSYSSSSLSERRKTRRRNVALLYGTSHCQDLHQRLVQVEGMIPINCGRHFVLLLLNGGRTFVTTFNQDGIVVTNDWMGGSIYQ
jgi:hypothetical protein